jgi:hypothetical protein
VIEDELLVQSVERAHAAASTPKYR